jgi:hypothetical protein
MKLRLVTAGAGAAWESALVQACQAGQVPAQVVHRCYDLGDLLAVAAAGQAEAAVVAAGTRWLDRDALARLDAAGLAVVGWRRPATKPASAGSASLGSCISPPKATHQMRWWNRPGPHSPPNPARRRRRRRHHTRKHRRRRIRS